MYFGTYYFGPITNKDYFGCLYFGPIGSIPAPVSHGVIFGAGSSGGIGLERVRHPWLIREWDDEEIITILQAIMRTIDN